MRRNSRIARWLLIYALAYCVGAGLDLWTTFVATSVGIPEGNTYTLDNGSYVATRALAINVAGGLVMLALWGFGLARAGAVAPRWLEHPFASWKRFYINPFARQVADRAPLHCVALAVGFVAFRVLAALNNIMLIVGLPGFIGWAIFALAPKIGQTAAFILIVAIWFIGLSVLSSPIAVAIVRRRRDQLGMESVA